MTFDANARDLHSPTRAGRQMRGDFKRNELSNGPEPKKMKMNNNAGQSRPTK